MNKDAMMEDWNNNIATFFKKWNLDDEQVVHLLRITSQTYSSLLYEMKDPSYKSFGNLPVEIKDCVAEWNADLPVELQESREGLISLRLSFLSKVDKDFSSWDEFFKTIVEMIYQEQTSGKVFFIT